MAKKYFTKEQLQRYEEIKVEMGQSIFTSIKQERDPKDSELFDEIMGAGTELVTLLTLYREQLSKQQQLPMSSYNEEIQNFNIVLDYIQETLEGFVED